MIVRVTQEIIDAVRPTRTYFTLEPMPWMYPDSVDSYVRLLDAVNRPGFAVHFDPVNIICSPQRYYRTGEIIGDAFRRLGHRIRSCHAKDILMHDELTTHMDEVMPGKGVLDYDTFLRELEKRPDTPLMLEHLKTQEEYKQAADHIRSVAARLGLSFG